MSLNIIPRLFGAAATALTVTGLLAGPAAHAAPTCTVNGSQLQLRVHPDYTYTVTGGADGSNIKGDVYSTVAGQDGVSGYATGTITGTAVDFVINWNPFFGGGQAHFTGTVGADGIANGTATGAPVKDRNDRVEFAPGPWESVAPLNCGTAAQAPPAGPPKQGPTATFELAFGGLVVHITDRSGVSSQCTYVADNGYTRSFGLPANSTFDLKIVPAVPEFRNWDVTITCDNGTSTKTTTFF